MNGWETMPGRDRIWLGLNTTVFVSTADPSGVESVRDRLRATAQDDPDCVLFRTAHPQRPDAWRAAADVDEALARAEELVIEVLPGRDRATAAEAARAFVARGTTGPAVRVFVYETTDGGAGLVGFTIPHAWGDAVTVLGLLRTMVSGPDPDGNLWTHAGPEAGRPLVAALRHRFGSLTALRTVPAARRAGIVTEACTEPRTEARTETSNGSDVAPTVAVLTSVIGPEAVRGLKAWRREHGGGASMNATLMALLRSALVAEGVALTDGITVAYDGRLYLPGGASARGNLVSAVRLQPADPTDPLSVHQAVQAAMLAGRPLLALAAGSATAALARRPRWPVRPAPGGTAELSFACVRVDRLLPPRLVTDPAGDVALVCVTTPSAQASVAAMVLDMGSEVHVTLTVHSPFVDPAAIRRALCALSTAPVALLPCPVATASA